MDTRKTFLIHPRFQFKVLLGMNLLALLVMVLIFSLIWFFSTRMTAAALSSGLTLSHPFFFTLERQLRSLWGLGGALSIGVLTAFNCVAFLVSFRVAGPLYRLQRHLEEIGQGKEVSAVFFREGDLFGELQGACNSALSRLSKRDF